VAWWEGVIGDVDTQMTISIATAGIVSLVMENQ